MKAPKKGESARDDFEPFAVSLATHRSLARREFRRNIPWLEQVAAGNIPNATEDDRAKARALLPQRRNTPVLNDTPGLQ